MSIEPISRRPEWDLDRVEAYVPSEAVMGALRRALLTIYTPRQVTTWLDAHAAGDPIITVRKVLRLCGVPEADAPLPDPDDAIGAGVLTDLEALEVVTGMLRGLLGCKQPHEVRALLFQTVQRLGGRIGPPAEAGGEAVPLDMSLGVGAPLLATPDPAGGSADRHLRAHLPQLLDDARETLERLERAGRLADAADLDTLTGLLNRRAYDRLAGRLGSGDVLILIDLDGFKATNDRYGHLVGDEVLRIFGSVLRDQVRIDEYAVRFGGDEFLVVLQAARSDASVRFIERLRIAWTRRRPLPVELSVGVGVVAGDVDEALEHADRALYATKSSRGLPVAGREEGP